MSIMCEGACRGHTMDHPFLKYGELSTNSANDELDLLRTGQVCWTYNKCLVEGEHHDQLDGEKFSERSTSSEFILS
jgi:hypothetical protein